jgi:predicted acylesterase/phospholipase RssA
VRAGELAQALQHGPRAPHVGGGKLIARIRAPSMLGSVMRATEINSANRMRQPSFRALADLLIEPPVQDYPILAFDRYVAIIGIGYSAAKDQIAAWQAAGAVRVGRTNG